MRLLPLRKSSGLTLVEVAVSTAVMSLIFGAMTYMIFVSARSTLQVREQSLSQQQAAAAAERITNTLRNAAAFRPYDTDSMTNTLKRVLYDIPDSTEASGYRTGIVVFATGSDDANESDGVVKIFEDESDYDPGTVKTATASWEYEGVQDFEIVFNSPSWITISAKYNYRGFTTSEIDADNDGIQDSRLAGEFITDVIAKNHHPGESAQYADTTSTLFQL